MKILMVSKGEYYNLMPLVAARLRRDSGYSVSAMTFATPTAQLSQMREFEEVHNLAAWLKTEVPKSDFDDCLSYLEELELSEEVPNLSMMIHADRIIRQFPHKKVITIVASVCRFWERLFRETRPDLIVAEVSCASEWIAWSLARRWNIQYLIPYPSTLPDRFTFIRGPSRGWESVEDLYLAVKNRGFTAEEACVAEQLLSRFQAGSLTSPIHAPVARLPLTLDGISVRRLRNRIQRIPLRLRTYLTDGDFEVGSYNGRPPWEGLMKDALRMVRHVAGESMLFDRKIRPGKYVYFPLHVQPEFTIDVRAPFCTNQVALIEAIAKSLPVSHRLVVKDHPAMRGSRSLEYYREIKKLYNVQLMSPNSDSHEIIRNAEAVITIVGTTAWEGLLYEKPVVALGPLCYGFFDLLYNCPDIAGLPSILSMAIRTFRPNQGLLLKLIWAALEGSHAGVWGDPLSSPSISRPENIDKIAHAIVAEIDSKRPAARLRKKTTETPAGKASSDPAEQLGYPRPYLQ
jgi:hypothetical protein